MSDLSRAVLVWYALQSEWLRKMQDPGHELPRKLAAALEAARSEMVEVALAEHSEHRT